MSNDLSPDEQLWPTPKYAQEITFEGRGCVVMAPEEYAALYDAYESQARRIAELEQQLADAARNYFALQTRPATETKGD